MAKKWNQYSGERILLGIRRYVGAVRASIKYLLLFPIFRPRQVNSFTFGVLTLQDQIGYRSEIIPSRSVVEAFPGCLCENIQIGQVLPHEGSSISAFEMIVLTALVKHLKPKVAFEIGTSIGVTSHNIALNQPEDGHLFTLDLPPVSKTADEIKTHFDVTVSDRKMIFADRAKRRFLDTPVEQKITQLYGDSAEFDFAPYAAQCDFVFVDGSHAYEYVESDTRHALSIVKSGGIIVWHDYNDGFFWPAVARYLKTLGREKQIFRIDGTMFAVMQA